MNPFHRTGHASFRRSGSKSRRALSRRRRLEFEALENRQLLTSVPTLLLDPSADTGRSNTDNVAKSLDESSFIMGGGFSLFDPLTFYVVAGPTLLEDGDLFLTFSEGRHAYTSQMVIAQVEQVSGPVELGESAPVSIYSLHSSEPVIVTIDETAPSAPTIALDQAGGDSGVIGIPASFGDRVTNNPTAGFSGTVEANAIVLLQANNVADGLTIAEPGSGNEALPDAQWRQVGLLDLNNPASFPRDGVRRMTATAEDLAGNVSDPAAVNVFVDTQGPQISSVSISTAPAYDLFDPKPSTDGPTPQLSQLSLSVFDFPRRSSVDANFLYDAVVKSVAENPGHYCLVGDHGGVIPIQSVAFAADPAQDDQPATGTITLTFSRPLPDDRYTLTVSDAIVDVAGNSLDGESDAAQPLEAPALPSGDGQPGGEFAARFTVDARDEIGVWAAGSVYLDTNGNWTFDPENADATNEDLIFVLGYTSDNVLAGNFVASAAATADGFDKLAAYGKVGKTYRWLIDTDHNGIPNLVVSDPKNINGLPVAGDFDGNAANGDEVGLKSGTTWYLDRNHDFQVETALAGNMTGSPIVGDFDGDGKEDLGAWTNDVFSLNLSSLGPIDGVADRSATFGFPSTRERPVAGDFDGDRIDDLGLFVPDRSGSASVRQGEWYIFQSGGQSLVNRLVPQGSTYAINFTPIPLGNDEFALFGSEFALPIVGNFDPPVSGAGSSSCSWLRFTNSTNPLDVDADGQVVPLDVLLVITAINELGVSELPQIPVETDGAGPYLDVSGDWRLSALDALRIIDFLNGAADAGGGESAPQLAEGESAASVWSVDVDMRSAPVLSDRLSAGWKDRQAERGLPSAAVWAAASESTLPAGANPSVLPPVGDSVAEIPTCPWSVGVLADAILTDEAWREASPVPSDLAADVDAVWRGL